MYNSYEYYSYVIRDKRFWKVYDDMAKIVSKVMGYKLIKAESVNLSHQCKTGIPHNKIERVLAKLKAEYGSNFSYSVFSEELYIVYFKERVDVSDVEISTDAPQEESLRKTICKCDLAKLTPVDAMNFLSDLQKMCKDGFDE